MSERSQGGPVLRKRGAQKDRSKRRDKKGPGTRPTPDSEAVPRPNEQTQQRQAQQSRPAPAAGVRRRKVYDPQGSRNVVKASVSGDPARAAARDIAGDWRSDAPKRGRKQRARGEAQKLALRADAQQLAKDKGVPLVHAYRILKGQTTLNEVLKAMMRKERFEKLVAREGIDRELAGQVASGHLSKQRAVVLTKMRQLRAKKLHLDAIKNAELAKVPVFISVFGRGWLEGNVKTARPYDFDFEVLGAKGSETFFKHDVKALASREDIAAVRSASSVDEEVAAQGLTGTENRAERVRPDDEWMLDLAVDQRHVRITMRDGEQFVGRLKSFGRWDVDLVMGAGEVVTVFFHALHPRGARLGLAE